MDYGFPGQASRHGDEVSRTRPVKAETATVLFGDPVVQNSDGTVQLFGATNVATEFCGIAMRKVKSATIYPNQNRGFYSPKEPCDVLQRGGISVVCAWGTPTVGATVYVRTAVVAGTSPAGARIGDLGASNETGNCVALTDVVWSSAADARNVAELTMKTRQGV
jgi:hypothetical protein